jgi:hypothetical protein
MRAKNVEKYIPVKNVGKCKKYTCKKMLSNNVECNFFKKMLVHTKKCWLVSKMLVTIKPNFLKES